MRFKWWYILIAIILAYSAYTGVQKIAADALGIFKDIRSDQIVQELTNYQNVISEESQDKDMSFEKFKQYEDRKLVFESKIIENTRKVMARLEDKNQIGE